MRHDIAHALRALTRTPGVTVATSLLLGLGVAATTTLFAFVDAVLLPPLPYDEPGSAGHDVGVERQPGSPARRPVARAISSTGSPATTRSTPSPRSMTVSATLRGGDGGTPVAGVHVTNGFFDVFRGDRCSGARSAADEFDGATSVTSRQPSSGEPVIVLSHRLWQTLGADPASWAGASTSRAATGG